MSDDFIRLATKEILEDISQILTILDDCNNDSDVHNNSEKIERHLHNIKGLAPMMGKNNVGKLAAFLDGIMKKMNAGMHFDGVYHALDESLNAMKSGMTATDDDLEQLQKDLDDKITERI